MRENIENIDLDETQTNAKNPDFVSNSYSGVILADPWRGGANFIFLTPPLTAFLIGFRPI